MAVHKIEFQVDAAIISQLIFQQAGTVEKALLEAIMNSVDAGAKRCDVLVDRRSFRVTDNGRGFRSLDEIRSWFATFAKPQTESKTYGRFRIGRGQIFAKGKNVWRSNQFSMQVDAKSQIKCFDCEDGQPAVEGCDVSVELYDQMSNSELLNTLKAVEQFVGYMPTFGIAVVLNGRLVGKDARTEKWDVENDDAWMRFNEKSTLDVFNLGAFVRGMYVSNEGCGGVVVSKKPLDVNQARNDINSSCPVWKAIRKVVSSQTRDPKTSMTEGEREFYAQKMCSGDIDPKMAEVARVFTDVAGRHWAAKQLNSWFARRYGSRMTHAPKGDHKGDKVHQSKVAFVMADVTLDRFGGGLPVVVRMIRKYSCRYAFRDESEAWQVVRFSEASKGLSSACDLVDPKDQTPNEGLWLSLLGKGDVYVRMSVGGQDCDRFQWDNQTVKSRRLCIGISNSVDAWTDGVSFIAFSRNYLRTLSFDGRGIADAYDALLHEYCHDGPDGETHEHNMEFYQLFHDSRKGATKGAYEAWKALPKLAESTTNKLTRRDAVLKDRLEKEAKALKGMEQVAAKVAAKETAAKKPAQAVPPQEPARPTPQQAVAASGNPYKPGCQYAVLFDVGSKGFMERTALIAAVAERTGKSLESVGFAWNVVSNRSHQSNRGTEKQTDGDGKVKLVLAGEKR